MTFTRFPPTVGSGNSVVHHDASQPQTRSSCAPSVLRTVLLLLLLAAGAAQISRANTNKIIKENLKPGTTDWQLSNPADNRQIEGYASLTSVLQHSFIDLFVNTSDGTYTLAIYRMGWYGGTGGRLMFGPTTLPGVQQVTPPIDQTTGLIECQWVQPYRLRVPYGWLSGVYLVKLHGNDSGKESYIIFTIRDLRPARIVFQQSVTTYQAYNPWPGYDSSGNPIGESLYGGIGYAGQVGSDTTARQVSFNRPYSRGIQANTVYGVGAGDFLTHDFGEDIYSTPDLGTGGPSAWEFGMIRWLEHQGYDVTYITNIDTHEDIGRLLRGKAFLSVGHDEYWSEEMRSNVLQARDLGVSLGFFSGNYIYWPSTLLPDSNGFPNRTIDVDKSQGEALTFSEIKDSNGVSETEQLVAGGMWNIGHIANGDIVITWDTQLDHWVFANTGLSFGDVIPGLIGYEYDASNPNYPAPVGLQVLAHTQTPDFRRAIVEGNGGIAFDPSFDGQDFDSWYNTGGTLDYTCEGDPIPPLNIAPPYELCSNPWPQTPGSRQDWAMTLYQVSSGALVFNVGSIQWAWGLDDYFTGLTTSDGANNGPAIRPQCGYPFFHPGLVSCRHPAIDQITRNVLDNLVRH